MTWFDRKLLDLLAGQPDFTSPAGGVSPEVTRKRILENLWVGRSGSWLAFGIPSTVASFRAVLL